ncbi:MAG: HD domain-containing protein [Candidatus Rokubacteria bacterium]|nr:HD domain-containing protein [Candidatus Rokubacteria bacterium]
MVRMSDLVRGIVREKAPADTEPAAERVGAGAPPAGTQVEPDLPRTRLAEGPAGTATAPPPPREVQPAPVPDVVPQAPAPAERPGESAEALFGELQIFLGRVRDLIRTSEPFPWGDLERVIERVVVSLGRSGDLFWVANNPAASADVDYLAFHQARVAVLSMRIAADVGYDPRRLIQLGMAGCLIDVGLWQTPEGLLRKLDALSPDEQAQYHAHPGRSAELVRQWSPPYGGIVEAVLQHHERERGQGFPQGVQGPAISPDAKILGLVDTYTGLTVPPSSRQRLRPHEAIREIVRSRHESFSSALIKALLSEISVFPPGTLVRLNTGEVGHVVAVNRNHPLRPRVELTADGKGQRLPVPKTVDLSEAPFVYITGPVAEGAR